MWREKRRRKRRSLKARKKNSLNSRIHDDSNINNFSDSNISFKTATESDNSLNKNNDDSFHSALSTNSNSTPVSIKSFDNPSNLLPSNVCLRKNYNDRLNVASINARSISKKTNDLIDLFDHASIHIALISESWETDKVEGTLEDMQQMHGITWLGKKRVGASGGGAAIAVSNSFGSITELPGVDTSNLEIIWGIVTPTARPHTKIVVGSFYSSTSTKYAPLAGQLQSHVVDVIDYVTSKMKNVTFVIGGDVNKSTMTDVTSLAHTMRQHVDRPTRGNNILDIIISDMRSVSCTILPPLSPEINSTTCAPSNHEIPVCMLLYPSTNAKYVKLSRRKLKPNAVESFKKEFEEIDWEQLHQIENPDDQANFLNSHTLPLND